ncbi:T-complex 11, partial [Metschnikowia bicuspidata]
KTPKHYRRFRSRSLPIINYTLRAMFSHLHSVHSGTSLPPINLQSLKEIDLQEILKNPQLRHDILFDPQLQFRPNLDGERGRRKKSAIERYWHEIEVECKLFFYQPERGGVDAQLALKLMRLRALFSTLREILLSLLPMKDRLPVNEIIDIELIVQQLNYRLFDFVAMAKWLGDVFKSHCAPMRDLWVLDMISKFQQAFDESLVAKLVEGLRLIFSILEAMKLDVANHQIRIFRPVLIETATDFEKDYFSQLITHSKIDISDSLKWFQRGYNKRQGDPPPDLLSVLSSLVIELLLCRNMATEFPSTLAFDHTRLVLLRADVRQLVCVQLCIVLFKQVSANYASVLLKPMCIKPETIVRLQEQILAIVTDDNGNVKWTRNVQAIALQVVKIVVNGKSAVDTLLQLSVPQPLVDFCYNWLLKQIQPSTEVYGLMEEKIFKELLEQITAANKSCAVLSASSAAAQSLADPKTSGFNFLKQRKADSEMAGILLRISTLVKFHWSVFGDYYTEYV